MPGQYGFLATLSFTPLEMDDRIFFLTPYNDLVFLFLGRP